MPGFSITQGYNAQTLDNFKLKLFTPNQVVQDGHIHVIPRQVGGKFRIPRMNVNAVFQDYSPAPSAHADSSAVADFLEPTLKKITIFDQFLPSSWESSDIQFHPTGDSLNRELSPAVAESFLEALFRNMAPKMANRIIYGNATSVGEFDGVVTRAVANADVLDVSGASAITDAAGAKAAIKAVYDKFKAANRYDVLMEPSFKIFCSMKTLDLYGDSQKDQTNKGVDFTQSGVALYNGKRVVGLTSCPDDVVFGCVADSTENSNIHLLFDYNYAERLLIDIQKFRPEQDYWYYKMQFQAGTEIVQGEEFALYDGRS